MKLITLGLVLAFSLFLFLRNWRDQRRGVNPHELKIRRQVRWCLARTVEISVVLLLGIHLFARPMKLSVALVILVLVGLVTQAVANLYFRRRAT